MLTKAIIRQKRFAKEYIANGCNSKKAYLSISPNVTENTAQVEGGEYLRKPLVTQYIKLLTQDCPPNYISDRLKVLSNAKKDHVLPNGKIIEIRDNASSIASIDKILRITGALKDGDTNIDARSINFNMTADDAKVLSELADRLDRLENK